MPESELNEEEQSVKASCLAKLKRSSTMPTRVTVEPSEGAYVAVAYSQYAARSPVPGAPPREREVLRATGDTALDALVSLRDTLV